jgi:hypothetical protein
MSKYVWNNYLYLSCSVINDSAREYSESSRKELYLQIVSNSISTKGLNNISIEISLKCIVERILAFVAVLCKAYSEVLSGH